MTVKLSAQAETKVEEYKKLYPNVRSAIMPALYIAQEELGSITADAITWVAEKIGIAPVQVMEVATFYTMYYKKPVGKYHVQVCRTLSCALMGGRAITECVKKRLGTAPHEVSPDGQWSYEEVECLGSCGTGPMCQINDHFFENLTPEKLLQIMDRIEKEQPDLRFSAVRDALGEGLKGYPKSEVI
ncbi:MAG: NAD(P)H-dependent oxidoreductase subunit E [Bdellovibrionota bacterium]|nr:MAG: NAD(P)H-dependent oxidoreductase subunit E [Bdellovibrionota bacterium]